MGIFLYSLATPSNKGMYFFFFFFFPTELRGIIEEVQDRRKLNFTLWNNACGFQWTVKAVTWKTGSIKSWLDWN